MMIVMKVKTITVTYRSRTLGMHQSIIIDAQTNVCVSSRLRLLFAITLYFCMNKVQYIFA